MTNRYAIEYQEMAMDVYYPSITIVEAASARAAKLLMPKNVHIIGIWKLCDPNEDMTK